MIKLITNLEIIKEGRIYSLPVPENSSLGEIHDILFEMREFISHKILENIEKEKEAKEITQEA